MNHPRLQRREYQVRDGRVPSDEDKEETDPLSDIRPLHH